jgi:heptose-I-phosphate ethanolaminephosphotransferase
MAVRYPRGARSSVTLMIGNPYERKQKALIDFSLMKSKAAPGAPKIVQK